MILGVQIIAIVFGIIMVYVSFLFYKRKNFSLIQIILWEILWVGFIFVAIFPSTVNFITQRLGIIRAMDLFMIIGFILVISLSFYNYVVVGKLRKKIEEFVRRDALKDIDKYK